MTRTDKEIETEFRLQNFVKDNHRATANHFYHLGQSDAAAWIPMSERLPEVVDDVLCYSSNFAHAQIGFYDSVGKWQDVEGDKYLIGVTHWQPLPESPK